LNDTLIVRKNQGIDVLISLPGVGTAFAFEFFELNLLNFFNRKIPIITKKKIPKIPVVEERAIMIGCDCGVCEISYVPRLST